MIVEDIITVLVLVVLPTLAVPAAGEVAQSIWAAAGIAVVKLVVLGVLVAVVGARFVPWLLLRVARLRSPELFTLAVLVMAIAVAAAAYEVFGASMALGAFLAGMLVGQSKFSHQAGAEMLPLRDAFAVLFFVSVGMLFDFRAVLAAPGLMLGVTAVILVVKPLVAFVIVILCRRSVKTGLTVAGGLAQIGEFSFILAEAAKASGLMPGEGHAVLVAGAIVSISINPFVFRGALALEPWIERSGWWKKWFSRRNDAHGEEINAGLPEGRSAAAQAIVVGYGPVGQAVTQLLEKSGIDPLVVEMNIDTVAELRALGRRALYGDATKRSILTEAGIQRASNLVVTVPEPSVRLAAITMAREMNPEIRIVTRARYLAEHDALLAAGATVVCCDEAGASAGLTRAILGGMDASPEEIEREVLRIRSDWGPASKPKAGA